MSNWGIDITKEGIDVDSASPKDYSFTTRYDSFKIYETGSITLSMPSENIAQGNETTTEETLDHDLGYIPMFSEPATNVALDFLSASDQIVNDLIRSSPPGGGYSPGATFELATVYVTDSQMILSVVRASGTPGVPTVSFTAHDVVYYYTIYWNQADEEFNLL